MAESIYSGGMTHPVNRVLTQVEDARLSYAPEPPVGDAPPATTGILEFEPIAGAATGIWEIEPGIARFEDEDELFVVLSGRATLTFTRSDDTVEIGPGAVVRLHTGQQTMWHVHETLRKVYVSK